ncbi:hypothetical protein [Prevotella sp. HUN102]|uniref:hypothetical protein n=1 Tax=Prevotella sp. HUN102 TaxID=1392486 RepID=UPI0004921783|nr:hypothetical protein [Prevotella sp. HUN102]
MDIESNLHSEFGNKRPFTVPEDYFENLSDRIIAQFPAEDSSVNVSNAKKVSIFSKLKPVLMAASVVGLVFVAYLSYNSFLAKENNEEKQVATKFVEKSTQRDTVSTDAVDEAVDYMMIDEDDMYAYMSEN